ncbi:DUF2779 domain-containing protein [Novosphingobium sp.]|uniref:DUF2779 domain-containing protein n=1 Tax=Novosphingobium sp. TaxID=1874826 RepID=UPI0035B08A89
MTRRLGLSKTRIAMFEQCPKRLWLSVWRPELAQEDAGMRSAFAAGHEVGAAACRQHPDGVMIDADHGFAAAAEVTARLLASGSKRPLFEATFAHEGVLIRADIMEPRGGGWHLAEVKNTTGVKAYHLGDIATQLWVMRGAGVDVRSAAVRHIDTAFTLQREGDYAGLFRDSEVMALVEPLAESRGELVAEARAVLDGAEPIREPGGHCSEPFTCSFQAYCGRHLPPPPRWPVTLLPGAAGKNVARALLEQGLACLSEVPEGAITGATLARVHSATLTGTPYLEREAIRQETSAWAYPHTFLDFEAIQFAVPRWIGTKPYAQIPFQFSAHIREEDGSLTHAEFLSIDGSDPRRHCAEALTRLPAQGAVIAWSMSFERGRLLDLAAAFPDLAPALESLAARLVDLLPVVRRHYYHRDMRGSWSIKAVLPTLGAIGYDDLAEVKSGTDAQAGYLEAIDPATTPERAELLRDALLGYCKRDTEAMIAVLDALTGRGEPTGGAGC